MKFTTLATVLAICAIKCGAEPAHQKVLRGTEGALLARDASEVSSSTISSKRYLFIYFSAGWCPLCKKFTPSLSKFYETKYANGDFEVLFVSSDKTPESMRKYWSEAQILGFALKLECPKTALLVHQYGAENGGIPCVVLLDANDKLLKSSFDAGKYLGPDAALREYDSLH